MIRSVDGTSPDIAESAYVDEAAVVVGDVVLESEASVWPNASIRGDAGRIVIGKGANVQDNAVLHEGGIIGAHSTVGHSAIVHGATVAEGALIGMNATVLDGVDIGANAVIGAGAVVTEGTNVPPATLVTGIPAEPKADLEEPLGAIAAEHYVELAERYDQTSHRIT